MFLWFVGGAFLTVWLVFRDPAVDYRLVIAGALAPDVIDGPTGGPGPAHTLLFAVVVLGVVMVATRGRRQLRRRLVMLALGILLHLVLDGVWSVTSLFWWPAFGPEFPVTALPSVERGWFNLPLETAGAAVIVWAVVRFRLTEGQRIRKFATTGRLGRDLV